MHGRWAEGKRRRGIWLTSLWWAACLGCSSAPVEDPEVHRGSPELLVEHELPAGSAWEVARITSEDLPRTVSGWQSGHGLAATATVQPPRRSVVLELGERPPRASSGTGQLPREQAAGPTPPAEAAPPWRVELASHRLPELDEATDVPSPPAIRPVLDVAADGHALAVSLDGGGSWQVVGFDLPLGPLLFSEPAFAGPPAGLWDRLPATAELVALALETAGRPREATHEDADTWAFQPLMAYACAHPEAERLALGLVLALPERLSPILVGHANGGEPPELCVWDVAARHPAARRSLHALLGDTLDPEHDRRALAAWILAGSADETDQLAIAEALVAPAPPAARQSREGLFRIWQTWALAASTARRGAAPDAAVDALVALASGPDAWPYLGWALARVHAVRGLAAVGERPVARAALETLAAGDCPQPLPSWPTVFRNPDEVHLQASGHPLPCWAQAALARMAESDSPLPTE